MSETLDALADTRDLADQAATWMTQMAPIRYASLGCDHCHPSVALIVLTEDGLVDAPGVAPHHCQSSVQCGWPSARCDCRCLYCIAARIEEEG
jgi:hypothetical protein